MEHVRFPRALGFALMLYLSTFVVVVLLSLAFRIDMSNTSAEMPTAMCLVYLALLIPLILMCAKWYFRKFQPSFKRGLLLGVFTLVVFYILDTTMLFLGYPREEVVTLIKNMFTDWKFYAALIVVLGTTAYAGFEFDRTYTFGDTGLEKK